MPKACHTRDVAEVDRRALHRCKRPHRLQSDCQRNMPSKSGPQSLRPDHQASRTQPPPNQRSIARARLICNHVSFVIITWNHPVPPITVPNRSPSLRRARENRAPATTRMAEGSSSRSHHRRRLRRRRLAPRRSPRLLAWYVHTCLRWSPCARKSCNCHPKPSPSAPATAERGCQSAVDHPEQTAVGAASVAGSVTAGRKRGWKHTALEVEHLRLSAARLVYN